MGIASNNSEKSIFATIMAGGAGTRFWPASREKTPKQLLKLTGGRSMLQLTVDRLAGFCPPDQLLILTNVRLIDSILDQLPAISRECVIGEPAKRDTAPCIALAAALIADKNPDATMVVMPSDHVIEPSDVFRQALDSAANLVEQDPTRIVTFGIKPSYPAEVFGYIERASEPIEDAQFPTFSVERFREKPDAQTARSFLEAGTYYWNAGIFVWKVGTILQALKQFQPKMYEHIATIAASIGSPDFERVLHDEFCAIDGTSIDYAVMEKYRNVCVVEAPFGWDDLGNWTALPAVRGTDENGNAVDAKHINLGSNNCVIYSETDHLITTVGMQDCIIVHTADATLVANRHDEAAIKQITAELKSRGWQEYL